MYRLLGIDFLDVAPGEILIVSTGWEKFAGTPNFFEDFPAFEHEVADYLIAKKIKALGTDMPSMDNKPPAYVHQHLLKHSKKLQVFGKARLASTLTYFASTKFQLPTQAAFAPGHYFSVHHGYLETLPDCLDRPAAGIRVVAARHYAAQKRVGSSRCAMGAQGSSGSSVAARL